MKITSGATFNTASGKREYSITLDEDDAVALVGVRFSELSWPQKRATLEKLADIQVVKYLAGEEVISAEWAKTRIAEISARPLT